jgi:uncharacterized phage protein gp47/JayE
MFAIPSLGDLVTRLRQAFRAELPGTDAWLWPNNVGPSAKVFGGGLAELFGRLYYVGKQAFVLTADENYLPLHGQQYGIPRLPAAPAGGNVVITAADAINVPSGTPFQRSDGALFLSTAAGALASAGTLTVPVIAALPGSAGLSQPATPVAMLFSSPSPPTGPGADTATAEVDGNGLVGGADLEGIESWRSRILFRLRNPPHGGAPADYVMWARNSVPGVTRVYVERQHAGPGTVRVFPLFDDLFASTGGIADAGHIDAVAAAIAALAPAGAQVTVAAPNPLVIPVTVSGLTPNTIPVQQAVQAELADTFRRLGQVAGIDPGVASLPFLATVFSMASIWIDQAVANATGDKRAVVVSPLADVPIPDGYLPVLGTVSFV